MPVFYQKSQERTKASSQSDLDSGSLFRVWYTYDGAGRVEVIHRNPGFNTYNFYNNNGALSGIVLGSGAELDIAAVYQKLLAGNLSSNLLSSPQVDIKLVYIYHFNGAANPQQISIISHTRTMNSVGKMVGATG